VYKGNVVGVDDHKGFAPAPSEVKVFVVTASDSRTPETNEGGRLVAELARGAGFVVVGERLVADDVDAIQATVGGVVARAEADVLLLTGGTGVARRDSTVDAILGMLEKRIDGYGELFRMLSFAEIGPAAMLSRALGGTIGRVALFLMPGSPAGVRLAMERLILPELAHVVGELRRTGAHRPPGDHGHGPSHHH
jgi:molybdenum cofactor biosynthesis protein B